MVSASLGQQENLLSLEVSVQLDVILGAKKHSEAGTELT